jgi:integrase
MLHVAVDLGWLVKMPHIRKPRVRLISSDYSYLRTETEISDVLTAAREEGEAVFTLYATAIYTGMRAGELAGLQWPDVDFDRRLITVQRSFDGPTKAEDVRYVPILDPLLPVLRAWRLRSPGRYVFTTRRGTMLQPSAPIFQEVLHRVLDRAGLRRFERKGRMRSYIVFHDLRHTMASHWVANGGDLFRLQKILGHKSIQMTQRYAHLAPSLFTSDYGRLGTRSPLDEGTVSTLPVEPPRKTSAVAPTTSEASSP